MTVGPGTWVCGAGNLPLLVCSVPVCCTGLARPGARARCGRPRLDLVLELTVGRLQEHSPSAINNPACYQQTQEPPVTVLAPEVA